MATKQLDTLTTDMAETPITSDKHSSIKITRRLERSFYTYLIHRVCSVFRNFLGRPKGKQPKGSNQLKPQKIILRTCTWNERKVCDVYIYDIIPRSLPHSESRTQVYYFCGGGWQSPPSGQHWQLCAKLARELPGTTVSLVSYPLAPNNAAPVAFPMLLKLYRTLLQNAEEEGNKVIFAGDSSGGNIVLSVVLEALREDEEAGQPGEGGGKTMPHPVAILAISPSTDLTRSNPEIERLKDQDPILTPDFIKSTAKAWYGDWDPADRRVSPINADLSLLAKRDIKVHGVTGGYDILGPDAIAFRDKCAQARVSGEWLEWEKQMHCFVLTWPYGLREGREGVGWMIDVLRKELYGNPTCSRPPNTGFQITSHFSIKSATGIPAHISEMCSTLAPAEAPDVPAMARIFSAAFATDANTRMKAYGKPPGDMEDGMKQAIDSWLQLPGRCSVTKAIDSGTGEIAGWVCWGYRGHDTASTAQRPADERPKETTEAPVEAETRQDPVERLEALTNADLKRWMASIMPEGVKCMYIIAIAVHPGFQSRGIGSALIRRGTTQADRDGVFCWVHASEAGHRAFAREGFLERERLEVDLDEYAPEGAVLPDGESRWGRYVFRYMVRPPR